MNVFELVTFEHAPLMRDVGSPHSGECSPSVPPSVSRSGSPQQWPRAFEDNHSISEIHKSRKRKQVKLACTNCRKNHTACDSSRPCKRCVSANEPHLCADAPKRTKTRRNVRGGYASDGAGSSEAEDDRSAEETHLHAHAHSHARSPIYSTHSASGSRRNSEVFAYASAPYVQVAELGDPEAAFRDETDYLSSLYLFEFARRASIEVQQ